MIAAALPIIIVYTIVDCSIGNLLNLFAKTHRVASANSEVIEDMKALRMKKE
jgi:hypothetical protein